MENITSEKRLIAALVLAAKTDCETKRKKWIKYARRKAAFLTDDTIELCKIAVQVLLKDTTDAR